jgi:hypothetical protein
MPVVPVKKPTLARQIAANSLLSSKKGTVKPVPSRVPKPVARPTMPRVVKGPVKPISGRPVNNMRPGMSIGNMKPGMPIGGPGKPKVPNERYMNSQGEGRFSNRQMAQMNKKYKFKQLTRSRGRAVRGGNRGKAAIQWQQ